MTMKEILSKNWGTIAILFLLVLLIGIVLHSKFTTVAPTEGGGGLGEIEFTDSNGVFHSIYYAEKISELKKENKALYDSIKSYKDQVDFLVQFNYEKEYTSGVVHVDKKDDKVDVTKPKTYVYQGAPSDTMSYKLTLNSNMEPNWYKVDMKVNEKFTIINRNVGGGMNHTTIDGGGSGTITDVTTFHRKEPKKLKDYIAIGPSATAGYDPLNKNFGVLIGVSATIDLW